MIAVPNVRRQSIPLIGDYADPVSLRPCENLKETPKILFNGQPWERRILLTNSPASGSLKAEITLVEGAEQNATASLDKNGTIRYGDITIRMTLLRKGDDLTVKVFPSYESATGKEMELSSANIQQIRTSLERTQSEAENKISAHSSMAAASSSRVATLQSLLNSSPNSARASQITYDLHDAERAYRNSMEAGKAAQPWSRCNLEDALRRCRGFVRGGDPAA